MDSLVTTGRNLHTRTILIQVDFFCQYSGLVLFSLSQSSSWSVFRSSSCALFLETSLFYFFLFFFSKHQHLLLSADKYSLFHVLPNS